MAKNCFVEKEPGSYVRLVNTSGADVVAGEFCIIGGVGAIAQEDIASTASGTFLIGEGVVFHTDTLTTGALTFGTANALVYWDNTAKTFGDTTGSGLFVVGQVAEIKSGGVIRVYKYNRAVAV